MKKLRWLVLLMMVTILGLAVFQVYWLRDNYIREKKSLDLKTNAIFRETIQELQAFNLKLSDMRLDSLGGDRVKIVMGKAPDEHDDPEPYPKRIISTIDVFRDKYADSLKIDTVNKEMVVTMDKVLITKQLDSTNWTQRLQDPKKDFFYRILYKVDSLQDSLKISEVNARMGEAMRKQELDAPFQVHRFDSIVKVEKVNEVTVGFAKPITYRLQLGNTFPYLIKRISLPILFSILLMAITLTSFILLYKNLVRHQRLAAIKNEFISNISHELKTPIATVGVAIEALRNFNAINDAERTREYLNISSQELERLGLLVDKVLRLSMFEKQELELKHEPVNLQTLVNEVANSMRLQLEKNHAQITVTSAGQLDMQGDKLHLQSVVFNLLDNAIKYSKEAPEIHINLEEAGEELSMQIADNGIGIAPEYSRKVFEKFFRVPHGNTHNAKGYGLGLSYVAHVVRKHKGTIDLKSDPGSGTLFVIRLPKNPGR